MFGFQITGHTRVIATPAMTDVVDVQIEVIAPEEWRDYETLAGAENIARETRLPTHRCQSRCPLVQQDVCLGGRRFRQPLNRNPISFRRRAAHIRRELLRVFGRDEISHPALRGFREPDFPFRFPELSRAAPNLFRRPRLPVCAHVTTTPLRAR